MKKSFFLVLFFILGIKVDAVFAQNRYQDSLALVALYNNTNGNNWTNRSGWLNSKLENWYGVTFIMGRVVGLYLVGNNLTGSIPASIGDLGALTSLRLEVNGISGSIPTQIGNLSNLRELNLAQNNLSGSIPSQIGNLSSLTSLWLYGNSFSGSIPAQFGNLSALTNLQLQQNQLTGAIPSGIGNLSGLQYLILHHNNLTGSVSDQIRNLSNLSNLWLNDNGFTDLSSLSGLSSLVRLRIQNNKFTFEDIEPNVNVASTEFTYSPQADVGEAQNVTISAGSYYTMSVSVGGAHNQYQWKKDGSPISGATGSTYTISSAGSGDAGVYTCGIANTVATALTLHSRPITVTVESSSGRRTDSLALVALYNNTNGDNWMNRSGWLNSKLENWYGVTVYNNRVTRVDLENNNLVGSIPPQIGNLANLRSLFLWYNNLSGSIPTRIGRLKHLRELRLNFNELTGSIPPEIWTLTNLTYLGLSANPLTGSIPPEIGNLTNLVYLGISGAQLTGSIPPEIGNLTNLAQLSLHMNQFTGSIPPEIGNLTNLTYLSLTINQFTGPIPPEIGNLTSLNYLFLGSNQLTGSVPQGIWNLSDLATLSLRENQLTGSISSEIGNLTNLTSLDLSRNNLSGSIPPEIGNLTNLTKLFLSLNQLTGPIPPQIGNLANLTELYLSSNQLTGPIPPQIGNLTSLELLTFFGNQLTGSIPSEIGNLTSLRALEFAGNSLMGSIPTQIGNLTNLEGLYLSYNRFTDLPSLVSLSALKDLSIENNSLTFEDIEPNIGVPLLMFAYSPQDDVGEARNITIPMRQSFGVSVSVGGTHNQYQWYKDGSMISGATSNFYTINSVTEGDAGVYTCLITNTVATELTLHSRPITVTIRTFPARTADSLALVALYNSTAGTGWTNRSGWLSGNLESWYGVSVGGGRVTSLDLEGNNLLGSIPSSIGNLRNLTELYLDSNQLTGSIPIEIGNLKNLEYLWLNSNKLDGLPSLSGLSALSELRIERNHFTFEDIEPNVGIASYFSYSDQDSTGQLQDTIIEKESSFVMSVSVAGAHNNYQWKKDGSPISGATSSTYTINSVTTSDEGSYSCDITNTVAAALTLHSRPITVSLDASSVPEIDLPEVYSMNIIKITTGNRLQIRYALPRKASVRFWLYNIQGSKIIDFSEEKPAGYYSREVDMNGVSRGIYFLRIDANRSEFTQTSKFVLM